ncbi:MAG: energy-coupling factor transporter ATPase [Clostridiales bacterium]|nr:energy-coupling factor transporter ATPase [Clostridiales bacterium]
MQNIIEIKDAVYKYDEDSEEVLHSVNLNIKKGEFLCILGHNGCGKSTLAKLINGLYQPTEGTVLVQGMDTKDENKIIEIRSKAGMVFQNPDNQMVATIVEEDVAFGPENLSVPQQELRARVDNALKAVNMFDFKNSAPHRLSGGQKQRIAIAGILAMEPEIIIMDESTSMLDPKGRREVLETVHRLNKEKGITIVFITHFMEETVDADRIVVMGDGVIKMEGTPREIFAREEEINQLTLEVPPVTKMAQQLNERGMDIKRNILTFEELFNSLCQLV